MWPSVTLIFSTLFIAYVMHSVWTIYTLYNPKPCPVGESCLQPSWGAGAKHQVFLCTTSKARPQTIQDLKLIWSGKDFDISQSTDININVTVPLSTLRNGSLYLYAFLNPQPLSLEQTVEDPSTTHEGSSLTMFTVPTAGTFNLLNDKENPDDKKKKKTDEKPISHWKSRISLNIMAEPLPLFRKNIPFEISPFLKLNKKKQYLPMIYMSELSFRMNELIPLNVSKRVMPLTVQVSAISVGRLRLMVTVQHALKNLHSLGFTEKDTDEVKGIFFDTNIYLLLATCLVSGFHLIFDFLAFKNDITFWHGRKDMVGLSFSTLVWRCVSQAIISFYLLDENTSLLVLCPAFIAAVIEMWKVSKASKTTVTFNRIIPKIQFGAASKEEKATEEYDSESMRYLSYLLYPLVICGAVYSLLYTPHKGWYSWLIQSLANGVYAFGFLFMLPQLFVNYRLKSVAHLPWRAFMYKAFNTFIDDLFAFIITMPTAHRVACFRDDFVFLIYLYQRWLYPVDRTRMNEYGQTHEDEPSKKTN